MMTILFTFLVMALSAAPQQMRTIKLNAGLDADVLALGRSVDRHNLTVSMRISNRGTGIVYVLLVGKFLATDNTGGAFNEQMDLAGIAQCGLNAGVPSYCIGAPVFEAIYFAQPETYTRIDPGRDITVNARLRSSQVAGGPLVSLSANLAYWTVSEPEKESFMSPADKRKQIRMMSLSVPSTPVTDAQ